jgi:hypothetical protein
VRKGGRPQIPEIVRDSDLPARARGPFKELFALLVEHYTDLLRANSLLFLNRLTQCEQGINKALTPQLPDRVSDIREVMKKMEVASEKLQRARAVHIFT